MFHMRIIEKGHHMWLMWFSSIDFQMISIWVSYVSYECHMKEVSYDTHMIHIWYSYGNIWNLFIRESYEYNFIWFTYKLIHTIVICFATYEHHMNGFANDFHIIIILFSYIKNFIWVSCAAIFPMFNVGLCEVNLPMVVYLWVGAMYKSQFLFLVVIFLL